MAEIFVNNNAVEVIGLKRTIITVACVLSLIVTAWFYISNKRQSSEVTALTLNNSSYEKRLICSGVIEPSDDCTLSKSYNSVLQDVYVEAGEWVEKGQKLAKLNEAKTRAANSDWVDFGRYVYADRSGTVTYIADTDGKIIAADAPIAAVAAPDDMCVRIKVPESNAQNVIAGSEVTVTGSGLAGSYSGKVDRIYKIGTKNAGGSTTLDAIVTLDNADDGVVSGFSVKVSIVTDREEDVLLVPFSATQSDAGGDYVYLIEDGRASKTYFEHSDICENGFVVQHGLFAGQQIVSDLSDFSGGKIRVVG